MALFPLHLHKRNVRYMQQVILAYYYYALQCNKILSSNNNKQQGVALKGRNTTGP